MLQATRQMIINSNKKLFWFQDKLPSPMKASTGKASQVCQVGGDFCCCCWWCSYRFILFFIPLLLCRLMKAVSLLPSPPLTASICGNHWQVQSHNEIKSNITSAAFAFRLTKHTNQFDVTVC